MSSPHTPARVRFAARLEDAAEAAQQRGAPFTGRALAAAARNLHLLTPADAEHIARVALGETDTEQETHA